MEQLIDEVFDQLKDYRADELFPNVKMTKNRIKLWVEQFDEDDRVFILTELKHIFRITPSNLPSFKLDKDIPQNGKTYLNRNSINETLSIFAELEIKIETAKATKTKRKTKKDKVNQPELGLT